MTPSDLWARDNCACAQCLHPTSRERLVNVLEPGDGPHAPPLTPRADPALVAPLPFTGPVPTVSFRELDTGEGLDPAAVLDGQSLPGVECAKVIELARRIPCLDVHCAIQQCLWFVRNAKVQISRNCSGEATCPVRQEPRRASGVW